MPDSQPDRDERWQSPEHVAKWIANRAPEVERAPLRKKLVSLLPFEADFKIRVLDIGAGTGLLSKELLTAFPNSIVVAQDFSTAMLNAARANLAEFAGRVSLVESDLREPAWLSSTDGTFDAIVAGFALHSVPPRIRAIYQELFPRVKPGGCFMTCDNVTPPGPVTLEIYREDRHAVHRENAKAELGTDKAAAVLEKEQKERASASKPDKAPEPSYTLAEQMAWLKEAGFDEVDCLWKDMRRSIIAGFKH